jgi:hypothetical protein
MLGEGEASEGQLDTPPRAEPASGGAYCAQSHKDTPLLPLHRALVEMGAKLRKQILAETSAIAIGLPCRTPLIRGCP